MEHDDVAKRLFDKYIANKVLCTNPKKRRRLYLKKLLVGFLAAVLALTFVFPTLVSAAPKVVINPDVVVVEGFAFHCNCDGGNGKTYIVGKDKDFGKKMNITLTRNANDPKVWDVVVPQGEEWVCANCGCSQWISFSNKSGVPDGKNIQLNHPEKAPVTPRTEEELAYLRYRAYVQLWNDFYHGGRVGATVSVINDAGVRASLYNNGGIAHYYALLAFYGASSLPPYFAFVDFTDYVAAESEWTAKLERGLNDALNFLGCADVDGYLDSVVVAYGDTIPADFWD